MTHIKTVAVSGGFDPLHIGHVHMLKEAAKLGEVVVIVNSDDFLLMKKGKAFMPLEERMEILRAIKYVSRVVACIDEDQTVCKTLEHVRPDIFANGGDRYGDNIPEWKVCEDLGIKMVFGVGGKKIQSSSSLLNDYAIS